MYPSVSSKDCYNLIHLVQNQDFMNAVLVPILIIKTLNASALFTQIALDGRNHTREIILFK